MNLEEIVPDVEVDKAFEDIKVNGNKRRIIREAILKKICSIQLTVQEEFIINELKLVACYRNSANYKLTVRGKKYLYLAYSYEQFSKEVKEL